ncbi:MAG: hypothetical protein HC915_03880 [Anaerolineae bacterium]|nr:hypothetical protein [Anaerolineae bacterium]
MRFVPALLIIWLGFLGWANPLPVHAQQSNNAICVLAFADDNRNGVRDGGELPLPEIGVHLGLPDGLIFATHITTTQSSPFCFDGLPGGEYSLRFAESVNHQPTTQNSVTIPVENGQRIRVEFGAAPQAPILTEDAQRLLQPAEETRLATSGRLLLALLAAVVVMVLMVGFGAVVVSVLN